MGSTVLGSDRQLNNGETWTVNMNACTTGGLVWAHIGYNFDNPGHGGYQTSDCNSLL